MRLFTSDEEVLRLGAEYLRIVSIGYVAFSLMFIFNSLVGQETQSQGCFLCSQPLGRESPSRQMAFINAATRQQRYLDCHCCQQLCGSDYQRDILCYRTLEAD